MKRGFCLHAGSDLFLRLPNMNDETKQITIPLRRDPSLSPSGTRSEHWEQRSSSPHRESRDGLFVFGAALRMGG